MSSAAKTFALLAALAFVNAGAPAACRAHGGPASPEPLDLALARPEQAVPLLRGFLADQPDHPRANVALARALTGQGRHLEAVVHYDRAIEHAPVAVPSHYLERARALLAVGAHRREDALRGLEEGMRRLGPVVALASEAIEIEVGRGAIDAALLRLDALSRHSPRQETWLARRAEILELSGRTQEAAVAYAGVLAEIAKLPAHQRRTPAMRELEARATRGFARLAGAGR